METFHSIHLRYQDWLFHVDADMKEELIALCNDPNELEDRFYCDLSFGTAGMRGIMGAGTNRMNIYTVAKAAQGVAQWIRQHPMKEKAVAIAWDTRHQSKRFATVSALVLAECGIRTYLYSMPSATPLLSYTVRKLNCTAGIMITASHNTKEYNGFKIYDSEGCQMVAEDAEAVATLVKSASLWKKLPSESDMRKQGLIIDIGIELCEEFCHDVLKHHHTLPYHTAKCLSVVYSPLHGCGLQPISKVLTEEGYSLQLVEEQCSADGDFPTVRVPNPEDPEALSMGIVLAEKTEADLVIATDPDGDRVSIAVKHHRKYHHLKGNQIGALLINYLLSRDKKILQPNSVILKSIVTDDLGATIAQSHGVQTIETLTGFKYIGKAISSYEADHSHTFLMGYEESCGFLIGDHVRDKDAVVSTLLICEMAAYYKHQGNTLYDILYKLYRHFGYYINQVNSITFAGSSGNIQMKNLMTFFRKTKYLFYDEIVTVLDYQKGINGLPAANVLKYVFADHSWIAMRPSGTEPKLKIYYSIKGRTENIASARLESYRNILLDIIGKEEIP